MRNIFEVLNKIFEQQKTFREFFEISPEVWQRMQEIAKVKGYTLTDYDLRTADGKTLVTVGTEDSWNQILTLLNLEDLKNQPIRNLNINKFSKTKAYPKSSMYKIKINGDLGDEELPDENQVKEIITANLSSIKGRVQGKVNIAKQDNNVFINFNATTNAQEEDVKKSIATNFDKIIKIKDIDIEKIA